MKLPPGGLGSIRVVPEQSSRSVFIGIVSGRISRLALLRLRSVLLPQFGLDLLGIDVAKHHPGFALVQFLIEVLVVLWPCVMLGVLPHFGGELLRQFWNLGVVTDRSQLVVVHFLIGELATVGNLAVAELVVRLVVEVPLGDRAD